MGTDYHFVCNKCNKHTYAFRGGRVIGSDELNDFLSVHLYECDGLLRLIDYQYIYDYNDDIPTQYKEKTYHELLAELEFRDNRIKYLESLQIPEKVIVKVDPSSHVKMLLAQQESVISSLRRENELLRTELEGMKFKPNKDKNATS